MRARPAAFGGMAPGCVTEPTSRRGRSPSCKHTLEPARRKPPRLLQPRLATLCLVGLEDVRGIAEEIDDLDKVVLEVVDICLVERGGRPCVQVWTAGCGAQ